MWELTDPVKTATDMANMVIEFRIVSQGFADDVRAKAMRLGTVS